MGRISGPQHRYFTTVDLRGHEDGLPEVRLLLQEEVAGEPDVGEPGRGHLHVEGGVVVVPVRPAPLLDA